VKSRLALALALASTATGCGAQSAGDTAPGGLYGEVVVRPATPVCRVGTPCSKPAPGLSLAFSQHGRRVAATRTDERGRYRIRLQGGRYAVSVPGTRTGRRVRPSEATAPRRHFTRLDLTYDPGIR
jgi:hypothetical protein